MKYLIALKNRSIDQGYLDDILILTNYTNEINLLQDILKKILGRNKRDKIPFLDFLIHINNNNNNFTTSTYKKH